MSPDSQGERAGWDLRVDGRVAWVTGASRGLGRAAAVGLAAAGARVALSARSADLLEEVRAEIEALGGEALAVPASVGERAEVEQAVAAIDAAWGGLDIAINGAGISPAFVRGDALEPEVWEEVLRINLTGCFLCCRAAGRLMLERGGGSIVNVSSIHGSVGESRLAAYAASKGGMEALTRSLALDWASKGVRVNAIAPGYFETDMTAALLASKWRERLLDRIPLGAFGQPEDLVAAILFLAGDASRFMTGATLTIDGGWSAQ